MSFNSSLIFDKNFHFEFIKAKNSQLQQTRTISANYWQKTVSGQVLKEMKQWKIQEMIDKNFVSVVL